MALLSTLKKKIAPKSAVPAQWRDTLLSSVDFLAIDLELTSLQAKEAAVTSIGWVAGKQYQIDLNSAFYRVIQTEKSLHQSPVVHGLTAEDIAEGKPLVPSLKQLVQFAHTHVWVFHNSLLDMGVLSRLFKAHYMEYVHPVTLDTLKLAHYLANKEQASVANDGFTLDACRSRHHMAKAPAHNALDDAMATMELLFAQLSKLDPKGRGRLSDLAHTRALA